MDEAVSEAWALLVSRLRARQPGCLRAAQPEPRQQRQDRIIAQAGRRIPVTAGQQPLDLGRRLSAIMKLRSEGRAAIT